MEVSFVGICSIDLYSRCSRLPNIGETIHGIGLNRGFGGKASNACAQFAFLCDNSTKPKLLTCVGKDSSGKEIQEHFEKIGIKSELIQISENVPTGLAICFVLDKGQSAIVIHPCPVTLEMVRQNAENLRKSKIVVTNFEIPVDVALETLKISQEGGATTILNVSPIPSNVELSLFANATIVIVNEVELKCIGSVEQLYDQGVKCVVVTLGSEGAIVHEKGKEPVPIPTVQVEAVDTTGAGDSFLGTFSYCLSKNLSIVDSAKVACVAASISVQSIGTQQSYPHFDHPQLIPILPK